MEPNLMVIWLVAGVVLFIGEMMIPAVGMLFAGCGALTVGMLLNFKIISLEDALLQTLVFVVATVLWTLLLWKPIKRLRLGNNKIPYHNIIGETAIVGEKGLHKVHGGEVLWSGAIMKAKLAEHSEVENLDSGKHVIVKEITGNTLIVAPKI
jgi:membrane protein implicated in regulation of membrane protease activity